MLNCGTGDNGRIFGWWDDGGMNETIFLISEVCYNAGLRGGTWSKEVAGGG